MLCSKVDQGLVRKIAFEDRRLDSRSNAHWRNPTPTPARCLTRIPLQHTHPVAPSAETYNNSAFYCPPPASPAASKMTQTVYSISGKAPAIMNIQPITIRQPRHTK